MGGLDKSPSIEKAALDHAPQENMLFPWIGMREKCGYPFLRHRYDIKKPPQLYRGGVFLKMLSAGN
jgi:hypothetical protein